MAFDETSFAQALAKRFEHVHGILRRPAGVAARSRQAIDEAGTDRVGGRYEHDWHGAGRL
jgi:hypothetical protein